MSDEIPSRNGSGDVPHKKLLPVEKSRRSTPAKNSTGASKPQKAPSDLQLPDLQTVAHDEPMTACLQRIAAGDQDAMAELHRLAREQIALSLSRLLPCEADAEDVIQTTFLSVWRKAGTFRAGSPVLPWLCGIARRAALDLLRTRNRRNDLFQKNTDSQSPLMPSLKYDPAEMSQHLDKLPELQRRVIELNFIKRLPLKAIAKELGITAHQARTLRRKALNTLKENIQIENL